MTDRQVSVTRTIAAPRQDLFDVVADHHRHAEIDGSGTVKGSLSGPERLELGAKFGMRMRIGLPYPIRNTVVEFEEGTLIAWRHFHGHRWRYELRDVEGGTEVTETFDWSRALLPAYIERAGYPEKHPRSMAATLERLDELVAGDTVG